jgi:gliding motility-associated-like protein
MNVFSAGLFSIKNGNGFLYESFNNFRINGDVFIFSGNEDISIAFSVEDSTSFEWYEYQEDPYGGAVKLTEGVDFTVAPDGKSTVLNSVKVNHGYFVEYKGCEQIEQIGGRCVKYVWIAIYEPLESVTWDKDEIICEDLQLFVKPYMEYVLADNLGYGSTGLVQRKLNVVYYTFKFKNEGSREVGVFEVSDDLQADTLVNLEWMPYVDTDFTVTDKLVNSFPVKLPDPVVIVTDTFYTSAVTAFPFMTVKNKEPNELDPDKGWETDDFGNVVVYFTETLNEGAVTEFRTSAPLSVDFTSNASPETNRHEWYFSRNSDFSGALVYYERELNGFIFREPGIHYIKLGVRNNVCPHDAPYTTFAVLSISDSEIQVPNIFTPNGDGINDEFKVAYRSIASYRCRIYNQWGKKVYDSTDITRGWDGTIGGRPASIGAYFYVIEAKGTDGRVIKKQGDINLVRSK